MITQTTIQPVGSPRFTPGRSGPIQAVVLHEYDGEMETLDSVNRVRLYPGELPRCNGSFHFGVDDCVVHSFVPVIDTAWSFFGAPGDPCTTANFGANPNGVTVNVAFCTGTRRVFGQSTPNSYEYIGCLASFLANLLDELGLTASALVKASPLDLVDLDLTALRLLIDGTIAPPVGALTPLGDQLGSNPLDSNSGGLTGFDKMGIDYDLDGGGGLITIAGSRYYTWGGANYAPEAQGLVAHSIHAKLTGGLLDHTMRAIIFTGTGSQDTETPVAAGFKPTGGPIAVSAPVTIAAGAAEAWVEFPLGDVILTDRHLYLGLYTAPVASGSEARLRRRSGGTIGARYNTNNGAIAYSAGEIGALPAFPASGSFTERDEALLYLEFKPVAPLAPTVVAAPTVDRGVALTVSSTDPRVSRFQVTVSKDGGPYDRNFIVRAGASYDEDLATGTYSYQVAAIHRGASSPVTTVTATTTGPRRARASVILTSLGPTVYTKNLGSGLIGGNFPNPPFSRGLLYLRINARAVNPSAGTYTWGPVDSLIASLEPEQAVMIRFRWVVPGSSTSAMPADVVADSSMSAISSNGDYFPNWANTAMKNRHRDFMLAFAARYGANPRVWGLDIGHIGPYGEGTGGDGPFSAAPYLEQLAAYNAGKLTVIDQTVDVLPTKKFFSPSFNSNVEIVYALQKSNVYGFHQDSNGNPDRAYMASQFLWDRTGRARNLMQYNRDELIRAIELHGNNLSDAQQLYAAQESNELGVGLIRDVNHQANWATWTLGARTALSGAIASATHRVVLQEAKVPISVKKGEPVRASLTLRMDGNARVLDPWVPTLVLLTGGGTQVASWGSPRTLLDLRPNAIPETTWVEVAIPPAVAPGVYGLFLIFPELSVVSGKFKLSQAGVTPEGLYPLGSLTVVA